MGVLRAANTSPLDEQIRNAGQREFEQMIVVAYATARALIARVLGREPTDPEVELFLESAGEHPAFAPRVNRLFLEGLKSSSHRRRRLLCSVLFGLPFTKIPGDDLDRVDLVVERMLPGDALLLMRIAEIREVTATPDAQFLEGVPYGQERPTKCRAYAIQSPKDLRIITSNEYRLDATEEDLTKDSWSRANPTELSSLESLGCVFRSESRGNGEIYNLYVLHITPLGEVVLQALKEVRSGFE